jgi:hypothetical protein
LIDFDEELFYKLCERYGVEIRKDKGSPMIIDEDGIERKITDKDIRDMFIIKKTK